VLWDIGLWSSAVVMLIIGVWTFQTNLSAMWKAVMG
jgi:hypothetical protein